MSKQLQKVLIWIGIAIALTALFYWLFALALPGAALAFAIGITAILIIGLTTGWYGSSIWFSIRKCPPTSAFVLLIFVILAAFVGVGVFVNKMIGDTQFFDFAITVLLLFLLSTGVSAIIRLARIRLKYQLHVAQMAAAQSKSELQLLQSQLSPHFLFNTLNNIYGHSLAAPDKVPSLILKLSDLLRYAIYDTKELFVPLQHELCYLNNYIEFEKVRLGERLILKSNLHEIQNTSYIKIAPMLLIVFIENAFKHSKNNTNDRIFIDIHLNVEVDHISFQIKNSSSRKTNNSGIDKHSGFGLESVKKRLALLYPENYSLKFQETDDEFHIYLRLTISKNED